jgi:hypothetical protein
MRTNALIDSEKTAEAWHYLNSVVLSILENYLWLKSSIDKIKIDHTTLVSSLDRVERRNPKNYEDIMDFLGLKNIEESVAARTIEKTREIAFKIRKDRKLLIKNRLIEG